MAGPDVASAIADLLAMVDRTPGVPSAGVVIHPDELLAVIAKLTASRPIGCGCLVIDDEDGAPHLISNPCPTHGADRPVDFYGDGFWAGYRGGDGIDPDSINADERAEWDAGYAVGLTARQPGRYAAAVEPTLRAR